MAQLFPFCAVYPDPAAAARVAAPPYDVVNRAEAARLAAGNPLSFLRVSRAELELPADTNPYAPAVYERAAANLAHLQATAPLRQDPSPALYVYALTRGRHRQAGIAAAFAVDDYDRDVIKKHERTRQDKEDDRLRHIEATRCHSGPALLAFRDEPAIAAAVGATTAAAPLLSVTAPDGVRHDVWRVPVAVTATLVDAFARLDALYIADGHHRAKSASRARAARQAANPAHRGDEAYNRFLAVAFPASELRILGYHRLLRDLNGLTPSAFLAAVQARFTVDDAPQPTPAAPGEFHLYLGGRWLRLRPRSPLPAWADPTARLDVSVLQELLLAPVLAIADPRTSPRLDFAGGEQGVARLREAVDRGEAAAGLVLHPVTIGQLMAIADAGGIMPPKSTWFEPKLADGLLLHCF